MNAYIVTDDRTYDRYAERQLADQIGRVLAELKETARERDELLLAIAQYRRRYRQQDEELRRMRERLEGFTTALVEAVQGIQRREGNFGCFATATEGVCDQLACAWRVRCLAISQGR